MTPYADITLSEDKLRHQIERLSYRSFQLTYNHITNEDGERWHTIDLTDTIGMVLYWPDAVTETKEKLFDLLREEMPEYALTPDGFVRIIYWGV
jgi:hypothetical protein